jgi:hypothetical protein
MPLKMNLVRFYLRFIVSVAFLTIAAGEARTEWKSTGIRADWSGRDFACSEGPKPSPELCNAGTRGFVAVCWSSRQTGECNNKAQWCTYKKVTLETPPDGSAPGELYICK